VNSRSIWWKTILRLLLCYLLVQLAPAVVVIASGIVFGPITTPDAAALSQGQILFIAWGSLVIVAAVVILLARFIDRRPIAGLGMTLPTKAMVGKGTSDIIDAACVLTAVIVMGFIVKKNGRPFPKSLRLGSR
jgi:hypothetical protein